MVHRRNLLWIYLLALLLWPACLQAQTSAQIKIAVFNFGTVNTDATGYGTTVTNMLITSLSTDPTLVMMDRKELESFLNLNDMQQNDNMDNVLLIGSRLGLDVIVVGTVEKRGMVINIRCNVIQIDSKRSILRSKVGALGDAGLMNEVRKLSDEIRKSIADNLLKGRGEERSTLKTPANVQKREGNQKVLLLWEAIDANAAGYEVYRSTSENGPYAKIAQVTKPEYLDEGIERSTKYFYKVRAFDTKGLRSNYSEPLDAESAMTPNPPVILSADSHVKSIALTWSPGPVSSEDPYKLKGYKLYQAKVEAGPYKEIANILGSNLGLGLDQPLDRLLKVPCVVRGLADGEDYYYKATAYNEKGYESGFSRPIKGMTIPIVKSLEARGDMIREIELIWNYLDIPTIRGYYLYRSTTAEGNFLKIKKIAPEPGNDRKIRYRDKEGLADKSRYYYRVTAMEEADIETSPSATVSAITKGKPPVPAGLQAKGGLVKKVELSWTAGKEDDIEGYNIYGSKQKQGQYPHLKKLAGRATDRFIDESKGMEDGTTYYYIMTSFNKVDVESEPAAAVSATTKPRPVKPSGLNAESGKVKSVVLKWTANPEKDVTAYHIFRTTEGREGQFSSVKKVGEQTQYEDRDLNDGQTYLYRIQAGDRDDLLSDVSDTVKATTKPKPRPPQDLSGSAQGGGAEIQWKPSPEKDVVSYTVYEKGFFTPTAIATNIKPLSYTDARPLKAGKDRVYMVTAVDKDGLESEYSKEVTVIGK